MKIPEDNKAEIIAGMIEMLDPEAVEVIEEIKRVPGRDLINLHGIYKLEDGSQVLPGVEYNASISTHKKLNHAQRIGQMIADSANRGDMIERLADYLTKYAKDRQKVIDSIPAHLSISKIRQN